MVKTKQSLHFHVKRDKWRWITGFPFSNLEKEMLKNTPPRDFLGYLPRHSQTNL